MEEISEQKKPRGVGPAGPTDLRPAEGHPQSGRAAGPYNLRGVGTAGPTSSRPAEGHPGAAGPAGSHPPAGSWQ